MWYLLQADGTLTISTLAGNQKVKNLRRDPRIAVCVGDETRSVGLYGTATISDDQALIREDIEHLVARYVKAEQVRPQVAATLSQQPRVATHFRPDRITEFSVQQ
jgi:general stress protein 26